MTGKCLKALYKIAADAPIQPATPAAPRFGDFKDRESRQRYLEAKKQEINKLRQENKELEKRVRRPYTMNEALTLAFGKPGDMNSRWKRPQAYDPAVHAQVGKPAATPPKAPAITANNQPANNNSQQSDKVKPGYSPLGPTTPTNTPRRPIISNLSINGNTKQYKQWLLDRGMYSKEDIAAAEQEWKQQKPLTKEELEQSRADSYKYSPVDQKRYIRDWRYRENIDKYQPNYYKNIPAGTPLLG